MQEITIDPEILRDPALSAAVERANATLKEQSGPLSATVTAEWSRPRGARNGRVIVLRLSDRADSAMVVFEPPVLKDADESEIGIVINRLWGDYLRVVSHRQIEALKLAVQDLDDDDDET